MKKEPAIVGQARTEIRTATARIERIIELEQQLANVTARLSEESTAVIELRERADKFRNSAYEREKQIEEVRKQFADLKERLHNSEMENHRLRGYMERVQEDDVVREELVQVGDPNGEQHLVPKRKSTIFRGTSVRDHLYESMNAVGGYDRDRPKPKHWVNY